MEQNKNKLYLIEIVSSMLIFGTIGVFRRYIPVGSALLAALRGYIGVLTILFIMLLLKKKIDFLAIKKNLIYLIISGAFIGINWILLFEAYGKTTVAIATLCYYMAPVFAVIASVFILKDKVSFKKWICLIFAIIGMVFISGLFSSGDSGENKSFYGVLSGLGAAIFYAGVILLNQKIKEIKAYDKTIMQLLVAAITVTPYALLVENNSFSSIDYVAIIFILFVGIVNTGVAYSLYFGSMSGFSAQTVALLGYIDPAVAVILSVTLLKESFGIYEIVGLVLILGSTIVSELPNKKSVN